MNCKHSLQKRNAERYEKVARLPMDHPCSLTNISKSEEALDVDMYVFIAYLNKRIIYPHYKRPQKEKRDHFNVITKVSAFMGRGYFCDTCLKGFSD